MVCVFFDPNLYQHANQLQENEAAFLIVDQVDGYADGLFIKPSGNNLLITYGCTSQLAGNVRLTATFQRITLAISELRLDEEQLVMSRKQFIRELKQLTKALENPS